MKGKITSSSKVAKKQRHLKLIKYEKTKQTFVYDNLRMKMSSTKAFWLQERQRTKNR